MGQSFSALCMDGVILFTGCLSLNLFFFLLRGCAVHAKRRATERVCTLLL